MAKPEPRQHRSGAEPRSQAGSEGRSRSQSGLTWKLWAIIAALVVAGAGGGAYAVYGRAGAAAEPPVYAVRVLNKFPHDPSAYTQGLIFDQGLLIEGTGKYGQSTLREVRLEDGKVERQVDLDDAYFGEGVALLGDKLYQLTWKERTCLVYDRRTLGYVKSFRYDGQGWGLTTNGVHLIMSDGSSRLRFLDPETFRVVKRLDVRTGRRRVENLNELEFIEGSIYANVWYKDYILKISARTGQVEAILDLRGLYNNRVDRDDVLNGIAYDAVGKRLFVTGKRWPLIYQIRVVR